MAKLFNECELAIRLILEYNQLYYISPKTATKHTYPVAAYQELSTMSLKPKKQQLKVIEYETNINRQSKTISTCVTYFVAMETLGIINMQQKMKSKGFTAIDKRNQLVKKIMKNQFACQEFLSEEGHTVAVHEKM